MHLATLAKFSTNRGSEISWRFMQTEDGDCFALRHDGKRWSYIDIDEMREGYRTMLSWGFAPVDLMAVTGG